MAVTFVTNGGTSVTKLENVEELPTPLPTTTKANNIFVGWFYDSGFEVQAFSGDAISSNITLYAKWYTNMEDFYEDVADEIRIKNGETNPIKHTDFAYKIKNIQGAKPEETKTVTDPNFSSGNIVVTPDTGKVLTQVTVVKDNDLVPENIVKDVNIFGVVGTVETGGGASGGYDVFIDNNGGGNYITLYVKFSDDTALTVDFPDYSVLGSYSYLDINLKNVVWLRVVDYGVSWSNSTGITLSQATNSAGYTLTQNVEIYLRD